ncbi:MAG: twin-arginine translocase subunit TatB [Acidimicrobiaceae bacterium]|nr:twin-arginine translocase subunit TatB [Acidimicrobiaceae bacterium]
MFNIGGGELLVIFLVVLIFIGPTKLPEVARTLGKIASSIKKMNTNFQDEMKRSFDEPIETIARERGHALLDNQNDQSLDKNLNATEDNNEAE